MEHSPLDDSDRQIDVQKLAHIGAVVVAWAMLEYALERLLWNLSRLPDHHGRMLTAKLSWRDKADAIKEMLADDESSRAEKIRFDLKSLQSLAEHRNRLAHGVWTRDPGTGAMVIVTTRSKPSQPGAKGKSTGAPRVHGFFPTHHLTNLQMADLRDTMVEVGAALMQASDELEQEAKA